MTDNSKTTFVNPYSFVPLPSVIRRVEPAWHDRLGEGRFAGRVRFSLTAVTPVTTVPVTGVEEPPDRIFGTSLTGAIRSVHEVLAGGCLRVFDEDYRPGSYRETAETENTKGYHLARVGDKEHGLQKFEICDDGQGGDSPAWILIDSVKAFPGGVVDGDLLRVTAEVSAVKEDHGRRIFTSAVLDKVDSEESREGEVWAIHVVDKQSPAPGSKPKFAIGRLTTIVRTAKDLAAQERVFDAYRRSVRDTDDARRKLRWNDPKSAWVGIPQGASSCELEACRRPVPQEITPGQMVWVRVDSDGNVVDVKASLIWRRAVPDSVASAGDRVPEANLSCGRHSAVPGDEHSNCPSCRMYCPTCRIFGLVEAAEDFGESGSEVARQGSYRGHVRVHDLMPLDGTEPPEDLQLAPLGQPRPGSGQTYLAPPQDLAATRPVPASEWGSEKDKGAGGPRVLRGRKFYWRSDGVNGREKRRPHHSDETASRRWVWPCESTFEGEISFENLTPEEIGSVLVSLNPNLLFESLTDAAPRQSRHVLPLGGGKPFGFGSVQVNVSEIELFGPDRYTARSESTKETPERFVAAFIEAVRGTSAGTESLANPDLEAEVWPSAERLLSLDGLDPTSQARIWYPPGASWREKGSPSFDEGFEFWKKSKGYQPPGRSAPKESMLPLPLARDANQELPASGQAATKGRE